MAKSFKETYDSHFNYSFILNKKEESREQELPIAYQISSRNR